MIYYLIFHALCVYGAIKVWFLEFEEMKLGPVIAAFLFGPLILFIWSCIFEHSPVVFRRKK